MARPKYLGELANGERHGQGRMVWKDGRKYDGNFIKGSRWLLDVCVCTHSFVSRLLNVMTPRRPIFSAPHCTHSFCFSCLSVLPAFADAQ